MKTKRKSLSITLKSYKVAAIKDHKESGGHCAVERTTLRDHRSYKPASSQAASQWRLNFNCFAKGFPTVGTLVRGQVEEGLGSYKCTRKRRRVINRFGRMPLLATEYRCKVFYVLFGK